MNDLIQLPTVEHINLEHQLANNKASEAVQHATNCGLMLLQVKASKPHGEWLPWLNGEIEAGRLQVKARQTRSYMQLAANWQRDANLIESPSIRAALELLSDREPNEEQAALIPGDVEAERKAREEAEAEAKAERHLREVVEIRAREFKQESNERRLKIRELETQVDLLKARPAPEPVEIEKIPADYEAFKARAAELAEELKTVKAEQTRLIQSAIKAKLSGYQGEVDALERQKAQIEAVIERKKAYLDSLDSDVKRIETHRSVIDDHRLHLINLAAFLNDLDPMSDPDTVRRWLALADMHAEAAKGIRLVFGPVKPTLTVIHGDAA